MQAPRGAVIAASGLLPARIGRGCLHRADDVLIAGAPAQVALEAVANLLGRRIRVGAQDLVRGEHHARRAEAALQAVLGPERVLQRGELAVGAPDPSIVVTLGAVGLHREARARLHGDAIEQHRARAALAGVAADLRAGQAGIAQEVDEEEPRLDLLR